MSSPINFPEVYKAAFEDFVIPVLEDAPFTTIQNRAKVTRSLKAVAGVERVHVKGLSLLQNEFGPNGEAVYEAENKDSRIRMVGNWSPVSTSAGARVNPSIIGDFIEITFYGTGLNIMAFSDSASKDFRASVDGGPEGVNVLPLSSSVIYTRNYAQNTVLSIASGLSLGWHTIRIRNATASNPDVYGFEIINQRTDLAVYSGQGISNGSSQGLSALATSDFNAGVSGTRGARVVKYVQGGVVSQAVQEVDATAKYLNLADHTNEEILRRINFREFGANRADDFSTLTTSSNRAFTLDDGTTTLVALNSAAIGTPEGLAPSTNNNSFVSITFVGTGLDIIRTEDAANFEANQYRVTVDGVDQGFLSSQGITSPRLDKMCSGLPYGTHTVRITRLSPVGFTPRFSDFIIYQPKKPSVPAGALEVADYNVMADYVNGASGAIGTASSGVMRKTNIRELTYSGSWTIGSTPDVISFETGWNVATNGVGAYYEYSFFGEGVIITGLAQVAAQNFTISIDGSSNLSAYAVVNNATVGGMSVNASTGTVTGTPLAQSHYRVTVSGLPLGFHKVRVTQNTSGTGLYADGLDIITPIHINDASLKIGSTSLKSVTKFSPEKSVSNAGPDLSKAKAWLLYNTSTQTIFASRNISAVLKVDTGNPIVFFEKPFKDPNFIAVATSNFNQTIITVGGRTTGSVGVLTANSAGTPTDSTYLSLVCYGELIDE